MRSRTVAICAALLACLVLLPLSLPAAMAAETAAQPARIDAAVADWAWRGVGDPLVVGQTSMFLFGLDERGTGAKALRLDWQADTVTSLPLPGLVLDKDLRYSSVASKAGVWLVGPSIALLRPDGRVLQAPLRVNQPPIVAQADGAILIFQEQEQNRPSHILSARLAPDGRSIQVSRLALLSFDARPDEKGQRHREPAYGQSVVQLKDERVLMLGGSRTETLASIFDPATTRMSPVAAMPRGRSLAATALLSDGRVVVAGARHLSCYEPEAREVDLYNVKADAWTSLPQLPLPLCANAYGASRPSVAQASDGSLVLAGGLEPELLVLARDTQSASGFAGAWRRVGHLPVPRIGGVLQALPGQRVVIAGGVHNPSGFGGCCHRTSGVDRVQLNEAPAAFGPGGLTMNGAGVARRGQRLFVVGGRRFMTTSSGQMRYGSQAEVIDLGTGGITPLPASPVIAGAMDVIWLDDDRVLVKGRLAASDRGFDTHLSSYMPQGSAAMALYRFSTGAWTTLQVPALDAARMLQAHGDDVLFVQASGGLLTWRVGAATTAPGPATIGGGISAIRLMPDGRIVLASNMAPSDIVSLIDDACEAAKPPCPERFVGLGPMSPARFYEVVKLSDKGFHQAIRSELPDESISVSHAIDMQGRVLLLNWTDPASATATSGRGSGTAAPQAPPAWRIWRTRSVGSAALEALPLPSSWRREARPGEQDCGTPGEEGRCQLLALADPRDVQGQATLLFLRSTMAHRDVAEDSVGTTKVWYYDEPRQTWHPVLQAEGLSARYAPFDLPRALFPGQGRLRTIGWHLEQPVLWVSEP